MSTRRQHWGIVGGGMLGMTLAHRLAQNGQDITLFEGNSYLGGLASAWNLGNVVWDRHYHVTLLSDARLRSILSELNLESEMQWVETRTGFYTDGNLHSMSNTLEFLRFPALSLLDKLRLAATIFYASKIKDSRRLERILVADWLKKWSGASIFEKIWLPLLRAKLGHTYKHTSAAFIWATIARMYAARRTGLKKEMFGYIPGGYARILQHFEQVLQQENVCVKTRHSVKKIEPTIGSKVTIKFKNQQQETFDQVVLTVPAPIIVDICPQLSEEEKLQLSEIRYLGVICASLLLKKPLANFYITNITDSGVPFTAVIEMSALVDRKQFGGQALVYLPKYVTPDDPHFSLSDQEIEEIFLEALTRMYPNFQRQDVRCFQVSRARLVLAQSTLCYSERVPPMSTSIPGLHIVNSAQIVNGTLNVNETVQLAEKAIPKLLSKSRQTDLAEAQYGCQWAQA